MDTLCPRNLVVGSHNLTGGGLWTNFESSTLIPLEGSNASVAQIQGSMDDFFARLNSLGESIMPIGAQEDVENLLQNGYVIKEVTEQVRQSKAAKKAGAQERLFRSEENTSKLQSRMRISYAAFCLKKKTNKKYTST